jgi:hypothetical protein
LFVANKHKGEIEVEIDGKKLKMSFSSNALCELEDALDRNVNEIAQTMQDPQKVRLKDLRVIFWASMLDHQPDTSIDDTKKLMSSVLPAELVEMIGKAFTLAFPPAKEGEGGAADSPPKPVEPAADGTGSAS